MKFIRTSYEQHNVNWFHWQTLLSNRHSLSKAFTGDSMSVTGNVDTAEPSAMVKKTMPGGESLIRWFFEAPSKFRQLNRNV